MTKLEGGRVILGGGMGEGLQKQYFFESRLDYNLEGLQEIAVGIHYLRYTYASLVSHIFFLSFTAECG